MWFLLPLHRSDKYFYCRGLPGIIEIVFDNLEEVMKKDTRQSRRAIETLHPRLRIPLYSCVTLLISSTNNLFGVLLQKEPNECS